MCTYSCGQTCVHRHIGIGLCLYRRAHRHARDHVHAQVYRRARACIVIVYQMTPLMPKSLDTAMNMFDMCMDTSVAICIAMCTDMCIDMFIGMHTDVHIGMCIGMFGTHVYRHVYGHECVYVRRNVHRHAHIPDADRK